MMEDQQDRITNPASKELSFLVHYTVSLTLSPVEDHPPIFSRCIGPPEDPRSILTGRQCTGERGKLAGS